MTISIFRDGSPPAHKLVMPLPLDLVVAMGGLTSKVLSVEGQFVGCDKMLLLLVHIWFNNQRRRRGNSCKEITD